MIDNTLFSDSDLAQMRQHDMSIDEVNRQLALFRRGKNFTRLERSCVPGDGITVLTEHEKMMAFEEWQKAALTGRLTKFVPASGAATRMFKNLLQYYHGEKRVSKTMLLKLAESEVDAKKALDFFSHLPEFPFYDELASVLENAGFALTELLKAGEYCRILEYFFEEKGLGYESKPKGLLSFHRYADGHSRTPFHEHLVEAIQYTKDVENKCRLHFTVSPEHLPAIREHFEGTAEKLEHDEGVSFDISFSCQLPRTDTIAVDLDNNPFRLHDNTLLFRPGGHGALIHNLQDLKGDIVFIKNVDNVVPDRLKVDTYEWKRILCGTLVILQRAIFHYLHKLQSGHFSENLLKEIVHFVENRLSCNLSKKVRQLGNTELAEYLYNHLHRPLRICGMVQNVSAPGGGPFWVRHADGSLNVQIVETAQINREDTDQETIFRNSTHFNPVDILCGLRDHQGKPYELEKYIDPDTYFISSKSTEGRGLRALEHPGLWNGAMAYWNTVFIEVPLITFNPVKTVFDLLKKEHLPAR